MPDEKTGTIRRAVPLFPRPSLALIKALADYRQALEAAHPLKPKHRAGLPADVKRLSLALTAERGPGPQANYLANPASLSAYLYYFLPWNIYRLSRLLAGLSFDLPDGASVLDLGCGPLTLVQALWMSRPELRKRKLRFVCVDQTGQAMRAGRDLFEAVSGEAGQAWTIELVQAPAHKAPMEPFQVVTAANALNELGHGRGEEGHEALERMAGMLTGRMAHDGRLLLVEPGSRLGGKLLSRVRDILIEEGLSPLAPCTHAEPCPMLSPRWRSWCHFVFPAEDVPAWLVSLTKLAGLDKDRASLSFSYMTPDEPVREPSLSRVVSHRFPLPMGFGAYACSDVGLRLLTFPRAPRGMVSGALLAADLPKPDLRDPKTGTWVTPLAVDDTPVGDRPADAAPVAGSAANPAGGQTAAQTAKPGAAHADRQERPDSAGPADRSDRPSRPSRPVHPPRPARKGTAARKRPVRKGKD